ncbi:MAG: cytochrome c oxidase subunit I [Myxococcales bacterium]|nr:cytochrome c oxidase subunit I [Myxococcales bacterium]
MATPAHADPAVHPASTAAGSENQSYGAWLLSWIMTSDHKRIGILYGLSALFFFVLGGIEALIIRTQLARPGLHVVDPATYNALFTMHGTTMIFLGVMPFSAAFFNYLVPLQIGARDVIFPRLNAFSFWLFLCGGIILNVPFVLTPFVDMRVIPDGGWFGYATLTEKEYSPGASIDFWVCGLQILGIASMAAGFNFIVTIFNLRAPGMTLLRMPVFTWMTLVVQFLVVLSFPCITIALVLLLFDRQFGTHFYIPEGGGDPLLWQHLFWLFGHPEVYILILPAMGIVSEVLPTFSRKPLFGAPFVIFSGITIGLLGFGVWSHHMFTTGLGAAADASFAVTTMLIAIPTGVKIFNWLATIWGGQLRLTTAMLFALGFVCMFTMGGLSGIMHASPPVDLQQQDSYFVVAHFHYVLFGGAVFGLLAGIYYWFPKMSGRFLSESWGRVIFGLVFVGFNTTFFPMHIVGAAGMPRRIFTYEAGLGWEIPNMIETAGAFIIAFGVLFFIIDLIRCMMAKEMTAGPNPWDASSLEWVCDSPPKVHNFDITPVVYSDRPVFDKTHGLGPGYSLPVGHEHIHIPPPSLRPLFLAIAVAWFLASWLIAGQAMMLGVVSALLATAFMLYSCFSWFLEPGH